MIDLLLEEMVRRFKEIKKKDRKIGVYYASEIPMCLRKLYYLYKIGYKYPLDSFLLMESGRMMHNWLNEVFTTVNEIEIDGKKYRILTESEGEVEYTAGEVTIRGRFDDIVKIFIDDEKAYDFLLEIKSVGNIAKPLPRDRHVMQLNFYMSLLNYDIGYILYISRLDYKYRVVEVKRSKELFDMMVERAIKLHNHIVKEIPPEKEGFQKGLCKFCEFKDKCWKFR